jgi:UDP-3-O-[3-hydroxymyristoyl] glucosamine N-acyltransferase
VQLTAREIAQLVGGQLAGNPDVVVTGCAGVREARPGEVTFVGHPKYLAMAKKSLASVIIIDNASQLSVNCALVRVGNPQQAFVKVVQHFMPPPVPYPPGIHPTAVVSPGATVGRDACIQAHVIIEDGAMIGDRCVIGAGSFIGQRCRIGSHGLLYPRVTIREDSVVGERCIIHSGVVIGADGFGFEFVKGRHQKIPQNGTVEIGDDVEIGANSAIDRGRYGKTRIGSGTKIDNLVQIAHNCVVGEHCIICGQCGLAGSVIMGDYVTLAGQVGVVGHITIGDRAVIMAQTGVTKDVPADAVVMGFPATPQLEFKKQLASLKRIPEMRKRLAELEKLIGDLAQK